MRRKNLTQVEKLEIIEKYSTGMYTCASLGKEYSISRDAISYTLKKTWCTSNK